MTLHCASWLGSVIAAAALATLGCTAAHAQDQGQDQGQVHASTDVDELARRVSNPASFMISVPVHSELSIGGDDTGNSQHYLVDVEPVLPFRLTADWNLISHTDFPLAYADPAGPRGGVFGLGDINQTISFTPAGHKGFIWAVGPQVSLPTATSSKLGSGKLSMGPSILLLRQSATMTFGLSADHLWSIAGKDDREDISATEVQPFVAWHIGQGRTISTNVDVGYDWKHKQWELPVSLSYSKVLKIGEQALSMSIGGKYWLESPTGGSDFGLRIGAVLLFPQKR